ncbi:unnamed protein product [Prorocentrum cordatum]|uniref:GPR180/TMEM145 transmembrane domain-containing protein n=1 Tax=Prorocentrum cordatum TaxID=2364126 RepID=A0ABN9VYU2_9DINO|nr:unnamed protein product [Polarella glacialis]
MSATAAQHVFQSACVPWMPPSDSETVPACEWVANSPAGGRECTRCGGRKTICSRAHSSSSMGDPIGALWPFLALAVLGPAGADGLLLEGWVPQEEHFHKFLGKFVVDFNTAGTNVAQVETLVHPLGDVKIGAGRFYLAAFDDEEGHWQRIRDSWETTSCPELLKSASWSQTIVMSSNGDWNNTFGVRQRLRPRFWYFALLGCGVETTVPLRYSLHVTNTNFGWQSEVPVDHKDMIIINTLFVIAFFLTTLTTAWAARWREVMRKSPLRDHPYLQLLLCSQVASFASCALWVLHDCLYLRSGMGSMRLGFLATMSATVASSTVFLIVILASTGWAIVTATLPCRRVFLGMVATVGGLSALCELHADTTTTQSSELYAYQSLPGFVALALKVFIFWWFLFQVKSTHEDEWDKRRRRFYRTKCSPFARHFWLYTHLSASSCLTLLLHGTDTGWWRSWTFALGGLVKQLYRGSSLVATARYPWTTPSLLRGLRLRTPPMVILEPTRLSSRALRMTSGAPASLYENAG